MKWVVWTFALFFALGLMEPIQSSQVDNILNARSEEQPAPIPHTDNANLNDPAVTMTVTVDSVTLPGHIGTLRRNELAHSIAESNEAIDLSSGVLGQNQLVLPHGLHDIVSGQNQP
jgi:hypothetical protein